MFRKNTKVVQIKREICLYIVCFLLQVLEFWFQGLPDDYAVKDLMNEIKDWIEDEYVHSTIWKRLQNCVTPGVLPTFSKRVHKRKSSESTSPDSKRKAASPAAGGTFTGKKLNWQAEGRELGPNPLLCSNHALSMGSAYRGECGQIPPCPVHMLTILLQFSSSFCFYPRWSTEAQWKTFH